MTDKLRFYTENRMMTICLFFSSIPFWVPILAFLLNGTDPVLMFLTSVLSIVSGLYISSFLRNLHREVFRKSLTYTILKAILFLFVVSFLTEYGSLGDKGDVYIASLCIIVVFYYFFIRTTDGFGIVNLLLWIFGLFLWGGFLYGLDTLYGIGAFLVNLYIFHRQHGRAL